MLLWGPQHGCFHSNGMIKQFFTHDRDDLIFINITSYRIYAYFLNKNLPFVSLLMEKSDAEGSTPVQWQSTTSSH